MFQIIENWESLEKNGLTKDDQSSVEKLSKIIEKLETEIHNIEMKSSFGGESHHGSFIFDLLEKAEVGKCNKMN